MLGIAVLKIPPDKDSFVRPFAEALRRLEVNVWYDDFGPQEADADGHSRGASKTEFISLAFRVPRVANRYAAK